VAEAAPLSIAAALQQARARGLDRIDAHLLLAELCQRPRSWLITHDDALLSAADQARWQDWLQRRADGVPVAYLLGRHEFHGLTLNVTPAVLDPRPDTETLVDWALECLQAHQAAQSGPAPQVLDLGTGSGAIALALKHRCPAAQVSAVDLSLDAVALARQNGEQLQLAIDWHCGSWFEALSAGRRFELIVSNPPYIRDDDPHLPALRHEPRLALTSGADGLDAIRRIVREAPAWLAPGGWLLLEHGFDQAEAVAALLHAAGFQAIDHRFDLAGHCRCTGARINLTHS
jgi:release factor glutamine methyltransferase